MCLDEGVPGRSNGGMLLWKEDEVRGKRIHPLGGIMRGSSCLPLGQTAHRCEGASGPNRDDGERWSPSAMTSFSEPGLNWLKKEFAHALNSPERSAAEHSGLFPLQCCLVKLWLTWRGTACQTDLSITSAASLRIKIFSRLVEMLRLQ